jgi:septal ring factor EnvC (AmiA/AmiB activator)
LTSQLNFQFLLLILLVSSNLLGQDREELEQRRYDIIEQIDNTNALLELTAKNKTVIVSDLSIMETQIENRKLLLDQIQQEIDIIDIDIKEAELEKNQTTSRLDSLREQYNVILRAVYRERALHNPLLSLLSVESVSQSFLKANFYNRLKEYVGDKLSDISREQKKLESEISSLNEDKSTKRSVLQQEAKQSGLLANEVARQKVMIASLQEDEASLKESLKEQRRDREQMNVQIENVIKSEFSTVVEDVAETSTASSFKALKGKMEWPVEGGVISAKYGKQRHPTMQNLTITNNGIDIRAPLNAEVAVVFEGKVVSVSEMSGFGTTIIVEHKQYYTVYSKLGKSFVQKGDILSIGSKLGTLEVKNESSELHFEIWNDNKTQNPTAWLKK